MGDTWGVQGPPSQAHSRVSRDLRADTAGFGDYLDQLPRDLTARFASRVRQAAPSEREPVRGQATFAVDEAVTVVPDGADRASLVLVRGRFEGGVRAAVGIGCAVTALLPVCFCDACDEDSESLVEQAEEYVRVVTAGFVEFRRPTAPASVRGSSAARRWRLVTERQLAAGVRPASTSPTSRSPSSGAAGCRDGPAPAENNGARLTRGALIDPSGACRVLVEVGLDASSAGCAGEAGFSHCSPRGSAM